MGPMRFPVVLSCLLSAEAYAPALRARRPTMMSSSGTGALLGQDGPLFLGKAETPEDEAQQLTASAAVLGVATACMGTAYAKTLKACVTATWKRAPALLALPDPILFVHLAQFVSIFWF